MNCKQVLADHPERVCDTTHGPVSYREAGAGQPLVLLHGISSGAASWAPQMAGLADERLRLLAWDAPGYGASRPLDTDTPLATDYARVLAGWVDALALDTFVLAGHSLGALMAAAYAHAHPGRVRRLILMSPARGYARADTAEREGRFERRMAMLDRLGPEGMAAERAPAMVSPQASDAAVAWVARNVRRVQPHGYRQAARMLADDDIARYASPVSMPVTVLSGAADTITPVAKCRDIARDFHDCAHAVAPGLGHALYIEHPEYVNDYLRRQMLNATSSNTD